MRAFVTGATGLLGNNLVHQLVEDGVEVVGLVRSAQKAEQLLAGTGARWVVGDVREPDRFADELARCEVVFHTAAYFREYYRPGNHAAALDEVNVRATLALMKFADGRGVRCFVHTSSGATVGPGRNGAPGDEDSPPLAFATENLYFKSKVVCEEKIRAFLPQGAMRIIEILPGWMWGPGDAGPTGAGSVALDFLARKIPAIPPGDAMVVDARDVARAMVIAAKQAPHGARFLVAGKQMTLAEVLETLERVTGVRGPRMRIPYALAMVLATVFELGAWITGRPTTITRMGIRTMNQNPALSSARAERELAARFRPFDETARNVVRWYREHPMEA